MSFVVGLRSTLNLPMALMGPRTRLFVSDEIYEDANATLQSETLRQNCVRCNNRKHWCKITIKKVQNVCDGGHIKHGSDFSCVCDAGHTVDPYKLSAIRQNNRNSCHINVCAICGI